MQWTMKRTRAWGYAFCFIRTAVGFLVLILSACLEPSFHNPAGSQDLAANAEEPIENPQAPQAEEPQNDPVDPGTPGSDVSADGVALTPLPLSADPVPANCSVVSDSNGGSMIDPDVNSHVNPNGLETAKTGLHKAHPSFQYTASLDVETQTPNLVLQPGKTLLSAYTTSPNTQNQSYYNFLAALNAVPAPVPRGFFAPAPYAGSNKGLLYHESDIDMGVFQSLAAAPGQPSIQAALKYYSRIQVPVGPSDHNNLGPSRVGPGVGNEPYATYYREWSKAISSLLTLFTGATLQQKSDLVRHVVQMGIILHHAYKAGLIEPSTGHGTSLKILPLIAMHLLNASQEYQLLQNAPRNHFSESMQIWQSPTLSANPQAPVWGFPCNAATTPGAFSLPLTWTNNIDPTIGLSQGIPNACAIPLTLEDLRTTTTLPVGYSNYSRLISGTYVWQDIALRLLGADFGFSLFRSYVFQHAHVVFPGTIPEMESWHQTFYRTHLNVARIPRKTATRPNNPPVTTTVSSITRYDGGNAPDGGKYGIRWVFSGNHQTGRYANGDYWVVGPVTITAVQRLRCAP